jgi:hypothetical protein
MIRYPYIHNMNSRTYLNVTNVSLDYCQATHALEPCFRCKEFGSDDKATTLKKCALCLKVCHEECSRCVCKAAPKRLSRKIRRVPLPALPGAFANDPHLLYCELCCKLLLSMVGTWWWRVAAFAKAALRNIISIVEQHVFKTHEISIRQSHNVTVLEWYRITVL